MRIVGLTLLALAACKGGGSSMSGPSDATTDSAFDAIDAPMDAAIDAMPDGNTTGMGGPPTGQCFEEWCWVFPLPQGNRLKGVSASGPNDVWACTEAGTMLHYDGSSWTQYGTFGQFGIPIRFWSSSANDIWMAAAAGSGYPIWHWNGTTWANTGGDGLAVLGGVGTTPWTVTRDVLTEWNGSQWITHSGPGFSPLAIGGSGSTVIAISNTGTHAQGLGNGWGTFDASSHPGNDAVVIDSTHIVVMQDGAVTFWDNGVWTTRATPNAYSWQQIAATSPTNVWVSMQNHRAHWDGLTWTALDDPDGSIPSGMSTTTNGDVYVSQYDAQLRRWNGSAWSGLTTGNNVQTAVWGTSPTDIWLLGSDFSSAVRTRHWNGTAWTEVPFPFQGVFYMSSIWGSAPNDYWLAGGRRVSFSVAELVLFHWNGSTWTLQGTYGTEDNVASPGGFKAIWGTGPDDVYAVSKTVALHRDANGWSQIAPLTYAAGDTADVFGSSASNVFVAKNTTLWRWDGANWTSKTTPAQVRHGWANSPTDVWLGSHHYDGTFFVPMGSNADVSIGTSGEMWTLGASMIKWDGGFTGSQIAKPGFFGTYRGWVAPDGHVWVAGTDGLLVH